MLISSQNKLTEVLINNKNQITKKIINKLDEVYPREIMTIDFGILLSKVLYISKSIFFY